jgi:hypothetical protein
MKSRVCKWIRSFKVVALLILHVFYSVLTCGTPLAQGDDTIWVALLSLVNVVTGISPLFHGYLLSLSLYDHGVQAALKHTTMIFSRIQRNAT